MSDDAPKKKDAAPDSELTPSGIALKEVGEPKKGASDEELNAHAAKYLEAKLKESPTTLPVDSLNVSPSAVLNPQTCVLE